MPWRNHLTLLIHYAKQGDAPHEEEEEPAQTHEAAGAVDGQAVGDGEGAEKPEEKHEEKPEETHEELEVKEEVPATENQAGAGESAAESRKRPAEDAAEGEAPAKEAKARTFWHIYACSK